MHFADRLIERAEAVHSAVCVGIDPRFDLLPEELRRRGAELHPTAAEAAAWCYKELASAIVEATAPYACAFKPQMAFYEELSGPGIEAFEHTLRCAADAGVPTIADAKRADIGSTSAAYARAFFGGASVGGEVLPGAGADSLTVNPYFGSDGVESFFELCDRRDRGVFVLVRTSNPSAAEIQDLPAGEGPPRPVWQHVAGLVDSWGRRRVGRRGYSSIGAVVGATNARTLGEARALLPRSILLVPGYGAQGGTADDVVHAFDRSGRGAVVNASRSIVFACSSPPSLARMAVAAAEAARAMRDAINDALARRK